jgi:hypothetical protein
LKYMEINSTHCISTSPSHPYLLELRIDPIEWHRFIELSENDPCARVMSHDDPRDGLISVRVACASEAVRDRLWDAW